ncbi:prepilin peptidase [Endozoicomonas sp. SM1973]|uniref:Prepilin leader peptidase/N-methyltransferase n=1 Tax=Spartinivicinus marinus TaxID=2994442 RepID=A0A853HWN3_9GAMM|nr:A24 family peptidase [Spartinivicinus marinus]MCX4028328.1 A24 family peptidase [Spartinivicinus marinus]NYZ65663.1 prepilin peptidase [Spartinivicinus marinus]
MNIIDYLASSPAAFILVSLFLGLIIGSFLNVVILRLPTMMKRDWQTQCSEFLELPAPTMEPARFNLIFPHSHCPKCQAPVKAWQNIPIVSYILLKGKCANCQAPISIRYPLIEFASGLLAVAAAYYYGFSWQMLAASSLFFAMIVLTMIDLDEQLLPDSITLPFLWLGLALNYFDFFTDLDSAVWGAIAGYLSLWSVYWAFKLLTGKEGMGHGDFKLLACFGAWLGWQMLPVIILLSSFVGALVGITMIGLGLKERNSKIPFGPYLAIAGIIACLWGEALLNNYLQIAKFHGV